MMRPGSALKEHTFLEDAAAIIELNNYDLQQARGVMAQYGLDTSWLRDGMESRQIARALFWRAEDAREQGN